MKHTIAIIGAGPAGITAAIQLRRYGLDLLLLEQDRPGGLLWNAYQVENYPGFPNGIPGSKLVALFEKQLHHVGVAVTYGEAISLDFDGYEFVIQTRDSEYRTAFVIVATGTKPKAFPIEIPSRVRDRVISEVWPLRDVYEKRVAIVGAGDAAFDYALNLADRGNTVTILNRGDKPSCLPLLYERACQIPEIAYHEHVSVQRVDPDSQSDDLQLFTSHDTIFTDYLIFAIGREPAIDFLLESVKIQAQRLDEDGKLYFVGDVHNGLYRQTAIAAGEGLRAAMQIYTKVRNNS